MHFGWHLTLFWGQEAAWIWGSSQLSQLLAHYENSHYFSRCISYNADEIPSVLSFFPTKKALHQPQLKLSARKPKVQNFLSGYPVQKLEASREPGFFDVFFEGPRDHQTIISAVIKDCWKIPPLVRWFSHSNPLKNRGFPSGFHVWLPKAIPILSLPRFNFGGDRNIVPGHLWLPRNTCRWLGKWYSSSALAHWRSTKRKRCWKKSQGIMSQEIPWDLC